MVHRGRRETQKETEFFEIFLCSSVFSVLSVLSVYKSGETMTASVKAFEETCAPRKSGFSRRGFVPLLGWVILIGLGLLFFPGTLVLGISGALLVLVSIFMAATDLYPGLPVVPSLPALELPVRNLGMAVLLTAAGIGALGWILPKTPAYHVLVSQATSGTVTDAVRTRERTSQVGLEGVALSVLRPGGKAQFGQEILDVIAEGTMIERGTRVVIVGHSAREAVVRPCEG